MCDGSFTEDQMHRIVGDADQSAVAEVARKRGSSGEAGGENGDV